MGAVKPAPQRARHVTTPVRFFARELLRSHTVGRYRLRKDPAVGIALRHATPDADTFDQIFVQRAVAAPAAVAERLRALGRPLRILDLGANIGASASWFAAEHPGATIVCVEPDPANLEVLSATVGSDGRYRVIAAAAGVAEGSVRFQFSGGAVSRASTGGEGEEVRMIDALALAGEERIDLVKIDIEGGEWQLLADPRLASLPPRCDRARVPRPSVPGGRAAARGGDGGARECRLRGLRDASPGGRAPRGGGVLGRAPLTGGNQ